MSRRSRVLTSSLAALTSAAVLTGCGTGLEATTYKESGRGDGSSADVGGIDGIAVRRLHVQESATGPGHEAGSTALVTGGLANNSTTADALVSATSDVATTTSLVVAGSPVTEVALPPLGAAPADWAVQLTGLTRELQPASSVTVTLEFRRAGRVTLQVPVRSGDTGLEDREEVQDPYEVE